MQVDRKMKVRLLSKWRPCICVYDMTTEYATHVRYSIHCLFTYRYLFRRIFIELNWIWDICTLCVILMYLCLERFYILYVKFTILLSIISNSLHSEDETSFCDQLQLGCTSLHCTLYSWQAMFKGTYYQNIGTQSTLNTDTIMKNVGKAENVYLILKIKINIK